MNWEGEANPVVPMKVWPDVVVHQWVIPSCPLAGYIEALFDLMLSMRTKCSTVRHQKMFTYSSRVLHLLLTTMGLKHEFRLLKVYSIDVTRCR